MQVGTRGIEQGGIPGQIIRLNPFGGWLLWFPVLGTLVTALCRQNPPVPLGICEFGIKEINLEKVEVLAGVLLLKHFLRGVVKILERIYFSLE